MCNYDALEKSNKTSVETIIEELNRNAHLVEEYLGDGHIRKDFFFNEHDQKLFQQRLEELSSVNYSTKYGE